MRSMLDKLVQKPKIKNSYSFCSNTYLLLLSNPKIGLFINSERGTGVLSCDMVFIFKKRFFMLINRKMRSLLDTLLQKSKMQILCVQIWLCFCFLIQLMAIPLNPMHGSGVLRCNIIFI